MAETLRLSAAPRIGRRMFVPPAAAPRVGQAVGFAAEHDGGVAAVIGRRVVGFRVEPAAKTRLPRWRSRRAFRASRLANAQTEDRAQAGEDAVGVVEIGRGVGHDHGRQSGGVGSARIARGCPAFPSLQHCHQRARRNARIGQTRRGVSPTANSPSWRSPKASFSNTSGTTCHTALAHRASGSSTCWLSGDLHSGSQTNSSMSRTSPSRAPRETSPPVDQKIPLLVTLAAIAQA